MAGFEVIVRPAVFPNIRPAPPRVLAPASDDPTQGIAVISGSGGKVIDLRHTWSVSVSRQKPQHEQARQFDVERVYKKDENDEVDKQVWIDFERLRKVRLKDLDSALKMIYADPPPADNVEIIRKDVTRKSED
jgi:hypothetical protein